MILIGMLSFLTWKRGARRERTAALEVLRLLSALAVVILLCQPEWRTIIHPDAKPKIAILWDDSKSMTTIDAPLPPVLSAKADVVSRSDWVQKALASELWRPLEADGANEVEALPFATPDAENPALSGSDIESPLAGLLEKQKGRKPSGRPLRDFDFD